MLSVETPPHEGVALADGGVYVFSVEHYDLRSKLLGAPRTQRYRPGGNLFFRLKREEVVREAAPYFLKVRSRPINAVLPLGRFMPEWLHVGLSRIAERVPGLRQFGDLVLVRATRPLRAVKDEASPNGSRLYCYLHRLTHRSQRSRARVA